MPFVIGFVFFIIDGNFILNLQNCINYDSTRSAICHCAWRPDLFI